MGVSFNETMREVKEESGCTRGKSRFQAKKRQRIGKGPTVIGTQYCEGKPHGMKWPYNDEEDEKT